MAVDLDDLIQPQTWITIKHMKHMSLSYAGGWICCSQEIHNILFMFGRIPVRRIARLALLRVTAVDGHGARASQVTVLYPKPARGCRRGGGAAEGHEGRVGFKHVTWSQTPETNAFNGCQVDQRIRS